MNGNFRVSTNSGSQPALWSKWLPTGSLALAPGSGPSGGNAVSFKRTRGSRLGVTSYYTIVDRPVHPTKEIWTLTGSAKSVRASGVSRIAIAWYDNHDGWLGNSESVPVAVKQRGWQRLAISVRPRRGAWSARIFLSSNRNSGQMFFAKVCWRVSSVKGPLAGATIRGVTETATGAPFLVPTRCAGEYPEPGPGRTSAGQSPPATRTACAGPRCDPEPVALPDLRSTGPPRPACADRPQ
jgi:hypothetical protein